MKAMQWGRLAVDTNVRLRRGAWYRVLKLDSLEAIIEVNRQPRAVPRFALQLSRTPPQRWTVVPTPRTAGPHGRRFGERYAVCPSCRERSPIPRRWLLRRMDCAKCRRRFEIDWNEGYLA